MQKAGKDFSLKLPKDPVILLSYINTQLRDFYPSLEELCKALCIEQDTLIKTLSGIDYHYNPEQNCFL